MSRARSPVHPPAEYFGVAIDKRTLRVKRIFNPNEDWEFSCHHVDRDTEYFRMERKDDWGVPKVPDGMTLEMVWNIETTLTRIYQSRNTPEGAEDVN